MLSALLPGYAAPGRPERLAAGPAPPAPSVLDTLFLVPTSAGWRADAPPSIPSIPPVTSGSLRAVHLVPAVMPATAAHAAPIAVPATASGAVPATESEPLEAQFW